MSLTDAPGAPGRPIVDDVDADSVTLSWTKPRDDGGNPVKGYVIEMREKGSSKWKPLNDRLPCKDTKFTGKITYIDQIRERNRELGCVCVCVFVCVCVCACVHTMSIFLDIV